MVHEQRACLGRSLSEAAAVSVVQPQRLDANSKYSPIEHSSFDHNKILSHYPYSN